MVLGEFRAEPSRTPPSPLRNIAKCRQLAARLTQQHLVVGTARASPTLARLPDISGRPPDSNEAFDAHCRCSLYLVTATPEMIGPLSVLRSVRNFCVTVSGAFATYKTSSS